MAGHPVSFWWIICWKFISPLMVICIFIINLVQYTPITYEGQPYPAWAQALGWLITLASIIWVPCVALFKVMKSRGTLLQRLSSESIGKASGRDDTHSTHNCAVMSNTVIGDLEG